MTLIIPLPANLDRAPIRALPGGHTEPSGTPT